VGHSFQPLIIIIIICYYLNKISQIPEMLSVEEIGRKFAL
jgi:hypothetical protein